MDNVGLAEQNYRYAERRVTVGVTDQFELRDASDQLDEARLNYFQAVFDFLEARSRFESAVGVPLLSPPAERPLIQDDRYGDPR